MLTKKTNLLAALVGAGLCLGAVSAQATVLLDADFNDVRRANSNCTQAMAASTNRTVTAITSDVNCIGQLPDGTTVESGGNSVNVRSSLNLINTTSGNDGFDNFFSNSNNFLVLGDVTSQILTSTYKASGEEVPSVAEQGTSAIWFPFALQAHSTSINVSFDWAFNGKDDAVGTTTVPIADFARASIWNGTTELMSELMLKSLSSDLDLKTHGTFSQTFQVSALPTGNLKLRFQLAEHNNDGTNTAFGIDNILVTNSVPEPATLALFGLGLLGLGLTRRGKI